MPEKKLRLRSAIASSFFMRRLLTDATRHYQGVSGAAIIADVDFYYPRPDARFLCRTDQKSSLAPYLSRILVGLLN